MTDRLGWARWDDVLAGRAQVFAPPQRIVRADRIDEVAAALAAVQTAAHAGQWAVGFVAYEAASGLDPALTTRQPAPGLPLVWFGLCERPVIEASVAPPHGGQLGDRAMWRPLWTETGHGEAVERIRSEIAGGEVYQCNLTTASTSCSVDDPRRLYADIAGAQRSATAAYLDIGTHVVISASPELFIEWSAGTLRTRPMKGTIARGRTTAEDLAARDRLCASEKDRAENVMIVDLLRNDLAKISVDGGVQVPALCEPERFSGVWQSVSEVTGRLRPDVGLVEIFRALFPCGSVTGAPKESAMRLIAELEDEPRGVYCGAIGVVAPPAEPVRARFSVAIRTAVLDRGSGVTRYGVGSGVTWSSTPGVELAELEAKVSVLDAPSGSFSLLETMRHIAGAGIADLERHLTRLADSASYFGFRFDRDAVLLELARRVAPVPDSRVRLLVHASGEVEVSLAPPPVPDPAPISLAVDLAPVDSRSPWLCHKTTRREVYTERAARHPEADDVVLVNERGCVTETTIASLLVLQDGVWCTPPVSDGCLPGVGRARLLHEGKCVERSITLEELELATGVQTVSALRGRRAARLLPRITPVPE